MSIPAIKSLFFAEFHPTQGPIVTYQYPNSDEQEYVESIVDEMSEYIIPKPELCGHLVTILHENVKIVGCPMVIEGSKYARNALLFNLAFVFDSKTGVHDFEHVIFKLALFLKQLEVECEFLSNEKTKVAVSDILRQVHSDINKLGETHFVLNESYSLDLRVNNTAKKKRLFSRKIQILDRHVPMLPYAYPALTSNCDLSVERVLKNINGVHHVKKLATLAKIDIDITKKVIKELTYHGFVCLVDIFRFENVYITTKMLREFDFSDIPEFSFHGIQNIQMLFSAFNGSKTVRDISETFEKKLHLKKIDMRKLVGYGVAFGILRRLQKYPVILNDKNVSLAPDIAYLADGRTCLDQLSLDFGFDIEKSLEGSVLYCLR